MRFYRQQQATCLDFVRTKCTRKRIDSRNF